MSQETIRAFIAIELSQEIKDSLGELQQILKETGADVKWVKPNNMHLTLKFLGETRVSDLDKIKKSLGEIANNFNAFTATLSRLGTFPSESSPRVIWADLEDKDNICSKIAESTEEKMQNFGFKKEGREFKTHLTLGRVRSPLNRFKLVNEIKLKQDYFSAKNKTLQVASISLIKSTLTPTGPVYETLFRINLRTT